MMNKAFLRMLGYSQELLHYEGELKKIFPETELLHVLETGTAQYNISVRIHGEDYVSSRIPVYEDGHLIGAASISRNVTEVRRLGQELSGANQIVDTLRSFSHEFNNKLHVILGYLEQQHPNEAKDFIINHVGEVPANIGKVTKEIESTGIAAIIIGKMVEANNSGIKLELQSDSYCTNLTEGVPFDCYVTVLGNLLQNAIDELKEKIGIRKTIRDYGIDEADFLARLDEMTEQAFDDQCTGANPRYPLMSEIRQMYLNAYYGN